ncbi:AfsR/SARP family transcriptional regulator [Streptomyces misionensis]|uniref:AfsR/SARP family transcriptional regulator n=1 Tax=Streptomyces misionensis TaxID=67331 RepID=A0A5C6IWZ5_9ACTN|nr:BTAD domain-containing putative transcriptional regulator [Streptomyces misionensis]TWV32865.1 AfsR/SARP family transcriptional regulator [Streptomyces misionensis]
MNPVRYRLLGPTQALRPDGTAVPVGGARLRALLSVLALRAGRTVPVGVLVDEVWGADPPADAAGALQALVGRLRRALGADAVASAEGGYRLAATADDLDLTRFDRLTGDGLAALAEGDAAKAAAVLDDALALWHGPALADLPDHTAEAARWETRRLDALRARHTAALALGQAESALPELTALCDAHPLDEPLQALRLRALRDLGRPAQALAAYEDVRRLIADRLGSDPGPELRALHTRLLTTTDGAGHLPGPPRTDRYGDGGPVGRYGEGTVGGHGGRYGDGAPGGRGGLVGDGGPGHPSGRYGEGAPDGRGGLGGPTGPYGDGDPGGRGDPGGHGVPGGPGEPNGHGERAGASGQGGQGNIPARLTSFVGREADLAAIGADLGTARLVTLLGPGGAGKTRLSQEAAEAVRDSVRDGVWLAELAPVDDPEAVPQAVLTAIGARETVLHGAGAEGMRAVVDGHDPLDRLVEHCARRRMLIVLDNCEHVVEAAARLAERLLARCPGLTVLATSREPLGVPGELVRPVEPLPEPVALRLFAERGAAARPGFRVEEDPEACAEICRRLDGLPLAIELAAARLRMLSPRQIADRLDDRFRLLTSGSRTVLPRQQTLRAVVDWSWDLLDADERDVLARLSVFAGGCDLAAAEAVCGPVALEAVGSLVDKSLVVAAPSADGTMRYRLLETVAEYAAERLAEAGRRTEAERAHLTYYRELARTTDPLLRGPEQRAAIARIQLEYENLRTALRHAVAARDEQEALCLVLSLVWFWQMRDQRIEARTWCREVMTLGPDPFTEPVRRAEPVWQRCTDTPPPYTGELLHEARRGLHLAHMACMDTELDAWQSPEARAKLRTVAEVYDAGMPQTCRAPGMVWFFAVMLTGGAERMRTIVDANVRTCRETPGFEWELAGALQWRANLLANRSAWAGDATRDADEALALYRRLGDDWGTAEALSARGEARERKGAYEEAAVDYRAAIEHAERLGARAQTAVLSARLGSVLMESGELEEGERLLREVVASQENTHSEAMPAARLFLACWLGLTGNTGEAREQIALLREEFRVANFVVFDAVILCQEALLDALDGREDEALGRVRTAMRHADDPLAEAVTPQLPSLALTAGSMALARVASGARAADAARALAAADALLPDGHILSGMEQRARAMAEDRIREALDERAYRAAYAEGGGLSLAEATALL